MSFFDNDLTNNDMFFDNERYKGVPVRCVAVGGLEKVEKPLFTTSEEGSINIIVPATIVIDAVSGMTETADTTKVVEGDISATIISSDNYTVMLSVEDTSATALKDPENSAHPGILPVTNDNPVAVGYSAWGILQDPAITGSNKLYSPVTTEPQEFYNTILNVAGSNGVAAKKHVYTVGISITPALPSGTYSTDVTITAATK